MFSWNLKKKKLKKKISVRRVQAVYGGFSPQRFGILHFILSMQLLKTWVVLFTVLENMYGST